MDDEPVAEVPVEDTETQPRPPSLRWRVAVMTVITAIALPLAWSHDRRQEHGDEVAGGPASTEAAVPAAGTPATTAGPSATTPMPPTTAGSAGSTTTVAGSTTLPEIRTAEDLARITGRSVPATEPDVDELPEITAPPERSGRDRGGGDDERAATARPSATTTGTDGVGTSGTGPTTSADAPRTAPVTTVADTARATSNAPPSTAGPPPSARMTTSAEQVQQLIRETWPAEEQATALRIAARESGYDAGAVSPSGCCLGIFQIHYEANESLIRSLGFSREDLFDAAANVRVAYALWQRSGWRPWS